MSVTRNRLPAGRGLCADCGTDSALTAAGDVTVHGPRDARCTGSGRPPRPPAPPMFVPAVGVAADTATESSATVEPASATARYQEGDRVRVGPGGIVGTVEAVYSAAIDVAWDDGRVQTRDFDSIEFVERPAPRPEPVAEVAAPPPVPTYTVLDEDDGEIDGGAVTPRAKTSHWDLPADIIEPSLLGMAQRRRIAVLESQLDASREEVAALTRRLTDALAERDILSREAAASAADARRSRDTLRGALDLIGRLGPA